MKTIPDSITTREDGKQLVRSSGAIGANYREANESNTKKERLFRLRISRKEAKESVFWLRLFKETRDSNRPEKCEELIKEADELKRILSSIIEKLK